MATTTSQLQQEATCLVPPISFAFPVPPNVTYRNDGAAGFILLYIQAVRVKVSQVEPHSPDGKPGMAKMWQAAWSLEDGGRIKKHRDGIIMSTAEVVMRIDRCSEGQWSRRIPVLIITFKQVR